MTNLSEILPFHRTVLVAVGLILLLTVSLSVLLLYPWQLGCQFAPTRPAYNGTSELVASADNRTLAELVGYLKFHSSDQFIPIELSQVELQVVEGPLPWLNKTHLILTSSCVTVTVNMVEEYFGQMAIRGFNLNGIRLHEDNLYCLLDSTKPPNATYEFDYFEKHFECQHFDLDCQTLKDKTSRARLHIHSLKFEVHAKSGSVERLKFSKPAQNCLSNHTNSVHKSEKAINSSRWFEDDDF